MTDAAPVFGQLPQRLGHGRADGGADGPRPPHLTALATARTKSDADLKGLVYSLTPKLKDEEKSWFMRPAVLGTILLICCVVLNVIFF